MSENVLVAETKPKHYHPALVTLHWLVAILVFVNLYLGLFDLRPSLQRGGGGFQNTGPVLAIHMATGITILALVVIRFVVRITSKRPADATSGNRFLDAVAKVIHYALYVFLLAITVIGLTFAIQTRRLQSTFLGEQPRFNGPPGGFNQGGNNPGNFPGGNNPGNFPRGNNPGNFPGGNRGAGFPRGGFRLAFLLLPLHLWSAYILLLLISLHILAALYHQFILKDHLIGRMWFGKAAE
jgi:cytochrome b561